MIRQSELAKALAEQRRIIATARLRELEALRAVRLRECYFCGNGPANGHELRAVEASPISGPELICRPCLESGPQECDFTDLPLVWRANERIPE